MYLGELPPSEPSWADKLTGFLTVGATAYQQLEMARLQTKRAKAGLPPLKLEEYSAAPLAVKVDIGPEIKKQVAESSAGVAKTGLPLLGLGIIAFLLKEKSNGRNR